MEKEGEEEGEGRWGRRGKQVKEEGGGEYRRLSLRTLRAPKLSRTEHFSCENLRSIVHLFSVSMGEVEEEGGGHSDSREGGITPLLYLNWFALEACRLLDSLLSVI